MLPKMKYLITLLFSLAVIWGCENHMDRAEKYVGEGEIKEAIEQYQLALEDKQGKERAEICARIGDLYFPKDTAEAIRWYWEAIMGAPDDPHLYIKLGEVFSQKEEVDSALWYYSKALELGKDEVVKERITCQLEELEFRKAKKTNTLEAYIDFQTKYPDSKYKGQVDDLAFRIVKSKPTLRKVNKFKEVFSDSRHLQEVKAIGKNLEKKMIAKKVKEIHKSPEAGDLPSPEPISKVSGKMTEIDTENDTPYILTVYYVGPETLSVSFKPHKKKNVSLLPGTYRVAAEADNPMVIPFKGTHTFEKGWSYESRFYIITY
ncbi:MAG: hypothetical protein KAV99_03655 [Candidatus Latescibacteria bacterium]|nr:hypothetical protein [Candidatus Latescibacterota bacterium]